MTELLMDSDNPRPMQAELGQELAMTSRDVAGEPVSPADGAGKDAICSEKNELQ